MLICILKGKKVNNIPTNQMPRASIYRTLSN